MVVASEMSELRVFLLGAPRAEVDGGSMEVDTRKALALLAYLAMGERSHRRDALAAILWPDYDPASARGALRRTLSSLRKALGGGWITADRAVVSLDLKGVWVDVVEFRRLAATDDEAGLQTAADLYRGDFMEGFSLRDGVEFEDWQYFQADELKRTYASVLERLVDRLEARGDTDGGLERARRWLALDPLHEPAHQRLMYLYALAGRRADALRQFRECVSTLDRDLGVAPLPETSELHERILRDEIGPRPQPAAPRARSAIAPPPLVGRAAEWSALTDTYAEGAAEGLFVAISGEAGVGKSRLAEAFVEHVLDSGGAVVRARCYEEESGLAYAPVVDLLRSAQAQGDGWASSLSPDMRSEVSRLLPEMRAPDQPEWPEEAGAQRRFMDGLVAALWRACSMKPAPGLILIDDLHWADAASLDLVAYAARRLKGRAAVLLATWRTEAVPSGHLLRKLLSQLRDEGRTLSLVLGRLSEADVVEFVRSAGIDDAEGVGARLYRETEGLPLFVSGYVAAMESREPDVAWSVPASVRDALEARVGMLTELGTQIIGAAAVVGRSFDIDTVRDASGRTEDETVAGIEELRAAGLVEEVEDVYDFDHELVRTFVYEQTGRARRRLLHRRVAEALTRRHRAIADGGRTAASIARHFHLGGRDEDSARYFRIAGEQARSVYANVEALGHFRDALALGGEDPADIHASIGDVLTLLGEYASAISAYETAAAELSDPLRIPVLEHRIGQVYQRRGAWDSAETHYYAALELLEGDAGLASRIHSDLSLALHSDRRDEEALELAHRALELAEEAADDRARAQTHNILGILWTGLGRPVDARRHLEESLALADSVGDPSARIAALNNLALAARSAGELERAIALTEQGLDLCARMGDRHREAALHNNLADLLRAAGRTDEAMEHLKAAVVIFSEIGPPEDLQPEIWKLVEW
jgi:DNA-binding SARP family transcriptional activator/predicted ATPase